jgi:trans-aconitate methyltransferase
MSGTNKRWDARLYDTQHKVITQFGETLIDLLDPQPGKRILDLGCGTGHLTAQIAERAGQVIGLDNSAEMIALARLAYPEIEFLLADAADFHITGPFDAVFSNAAVHWVLDPEGLVACVRRALKPGGRFVLDMGGKGNIAVLFGGICAALQALGLPLPESPLWYFPSPAEYATLLEKHGFRINFMAHFDRPTPLQGEEAIGQWMRQFTPGVLDGIPQEQHENLIDEVERRVRPALYRDGMYYADYVRLRAIATRME